MRTGFARGHKSFYGPGKPGILFSFQRVMSGEWLTAVRSPSRPNHCECFARERLAVFEGAPDVADGHAAHFDSLQACRSQAGFLGQGEGGHFAGFKAHDAGSNHIRGQGIICRRYFRPRAGCKEACPELKRRASKQRPVGAWAGNGKQWAVSKSPL
jgi:hypothetical protein